MEIHKFLPESIEHRVWETESKYCFLPRDIDVSAAAAAFDMLSVLESSLIIDLSLICYGNVA